MEQKMADAGMTPQRRIITIHELMRMSEQELDEFIANDERLLNEGIGDRSQSNTDFCGMTFEEIAEMYGCRPIDEVFDELIRKLESKL